MDDQRFDRLAKLVATTPSRRTFLKALGGGAGALAVAGFGVGDASAAREPRIPRCHNGKCHNGLVCCDGLCLESCCVGIGEGCSSCDECCGDTVCYHGTCYDLPPQYCIP